MTSLCYTIYKDLRKGVKKYSYWMSL